jgi:hypothetical protein
MPETTMGGLLFPRDTPLLIPHATRWEAPTAAAPLLLPRVCRRWDAPAAAALLLLPRARRRLHRTTRWKCGWRLLLLLLLLLLYACRWFLPPPSTRIATPPPPPPSTRVEESSDDSPSDSSGYNDECPHVKEVSSYEHCF